MYIEASSFPLVSLFHVTVAGAAIVQCSHAGAPGHIGLAGVEHSEQLGVWTSPLTVQLGPL